MRTQLVPPEPPLVKLSVLQQRLLQRHIPLIWLNPIDKSLGTPWTRVDHPDALPGDPNRVRFNVHCQPDLPAAQLAVTRLADAGLHPRRGIVSSTMPVLDRDTDAWRRALRERHERQAREDAERRRRVDEGRRQARRQHHRADAPPAVPPPSIPGGPPWSHCKRCGLRLDEILHKIGYHVGCEPAQWRAPAPATRPDPQGTLF